MIERPRAKKPLSERYFVDIFVLAEMAFDAELYVSRQEAEMRARQDGYHIGSVDGNGFHTYVDFDTLEEAVEFKLKYL